MLNGARRVIGGKLRKHQNTKGYEINFRCLQVSLWDLSLLNLREFRERENEIERKTKKKERKEEKIKKKDH